jgi:hypothetical protein
MLQHTSHVTRHTSHVTRHTSHVTRHTSHVTRHTSHVTHHTSKFNSHQRFRRVCVVSQLVKGVIRSKSKVIRHTSHVTRHASHVTRHTPHFKRCTSNRFSLRLSHFIPIAPDSAGVMGGDIVLANVIAKPSNMGNDNYFSVRLQ